MKPKPDDQVVVNIRREPFLPYEEKYLSMPFDQFLDEVGGQVAIALFKGELRSALSTYIQVAHARGKLNYHNQLLKQATE